MNKEKVWKVEMYGEGTYWTHKNVTYERACEIVENCPNEYMSFVVPVDEVKKDEI